MRPAWRLTDDRQSSTLKSFFPKLNAAGRHIANEASGGGRDCLASVRRQAGRIENLQQRVVMNVVGVGLARNAMLGDKVIQDNNAAFDDAPLLAG